MNRTARTITAGLIAAGAILGSSATAHADYTLPNGTRITTTHKAPRVAHRTTLEQFRQKYPTHVKVRRGDTLWSLATKYRGSGHEWRNLARLNGIKGTTIYAGQTLRVR